MKSVTSSSGNLEDLDVNRPDSEPAGRGQTLFERQAEGRFSVISSQEEGAASLASLILGGRGRDDSELRMGDYPHVVEILKESRCSIKTLALWGLSLDEINEFPEGLLVRFCQLLHALEKGVKRLPQSEVEVILEKIKNALFSESWQMLEEAQMAPFIAQIIANKNPELLFLIFANLNQFADFCLMPLEASNQRREVLAKGITKFVLNLPDQLRLLLEEGLVLSSFSEEFIEDLNYNPIEFLKVCFKVMALDDRQVVFEQLPRMRLNFRLFFGKKPSGFYKLFEMCAQCPPLMRLILRHHNALIYLASGSERERVTIQVIYEVLSNPNEAASNLFIGRFERFYRHMKACQESGVSLRELVTEFGLANVVDLYQREIDPNLIRIELVKLYTAAYQYRGS